AAVIVALGCRRAARSALEQERHRDLQHFRNLLDAAGTDAVGALLVFLDLLKGQPERFAELFLAHPQHDAAHPHPAANVFVNRVGCFRHLRYSLWTDTRDGTCLASSRRLSVSATQRDTVKLN